jgi:Ca-activated chloride channel family protein
MSKRKHLRNAVVTLCLAASGGCGKSERAVPTQPVAPADRGAVPGGDLSSNARPDPSPPPAEPAKASEEAEARAVIVTTEKKPTAHVGTADKKEAGVVVEGGVYGGVVGGEIGGTYAAAPKAAYGSAAGYGVGGGRGGMRGVSASRRYVMQPPAPPQPDPQGSEAYDHHDVNKLTLTKDDHESTFAIDVDTASYTIARRKILEGSAVPTDAVRVEEFVNYFHYDYEGPGADRPFAVHMEAAPSPYSAGRYFLRVGVQGKTVAKRERKRSHLVFLVDVSGSMQSADKLPLAQRALRILVDNLNENDTVSLVTYAGATRVVLAPTNASERAKIESAIDELTAGGSTAMGSGLELAYDLAAKQLTPDSETRVIVLSDGDANVGNTTHEDILKTIHGHVKEGVTLSTVGFGMGNYKDNLMEQLADKGNGVSYYIDGLSEAKRVFQEKLAGTLEVIAQDVKIQVDFDPKVVTAYRLVGYENRDIRDQDFRDDKVDAGEIGAGHAVTAVYEVELAAGAQTNPNLATVRIRAKKPRGKEAAEYTYPFARDLLRPSFDAASADFRFASAVVGFAEILRKSPYADGWTLDKVLSIARAAAPAANAERQEFLTLVGKAKTS